MAYALFAQRKIVLTGELNNVQLQQTQRSDEQYQLATQTLSLQQQLTSLNASQSNELAALYEQLANVGSDDTLTDEEYEKQRDSINAEIAEKEEEFESEIDEINREIYKVSVMENALEMEVKRLDTMVTTIEQQLEACEEAEGAGIERATPKFNGIS